MTISEHLQISVLSAPVAAVDRRSLSQAWYSALYGTAQEPSKALKNVHRAAGARPAAKTSELSAPVHTRRGGQSAKPPVKPSGSRSLPTTAPERRNARSALARKIERTFLRPDRPVRHATFAVEGTKARVHVVVKQAGAITQLVAVCPPHVYSRVANALLQARFALAARGISLETKLHEAAA